MTVLTDKQASELQRLKAYFPFRIVFAVIYKDTGTFSSFAQKNKGRNEPSDS